MSHKLTMLALAAMCLGPALASAQDGGYPEAAYNGRSPSIIRPAGYGPLWAGYQGDCGCGGPVDVAYDSCGQGCGPVCDPCCRPILGGVHHVLHRMTRSLDCLFPCRPRLNGDCSGCGTCGIPCGKAYCPRCRPRLLPLLHHGLKHCNGCATGCQSCCAAAPTFAPPQGGPMIEPLPSSDPFQDDPSVPPSPAEAEADARVRVRTQRPVSHSAQAAATRAPLPKLGSGTRVSAKLAAQTGGTTSVGRVQRATHATPAVKRETSVLRRVAAEGDDTIREAQAAGIQADDGEPLPFNPLR